MLSQGKGQERREGRESRKGDQGVGEEVQPTFCFRLYTNLGPTLLTVAMTHPGGDGGGGECGEEEQERKGRRCVRWEEGERMCFGGETRYIEQRIRERTETE